MSEQKLGILEQRKIEASIIKPIYERIKAEFGLEKAQEIIADAIREDAIKSGERFAKESGEKSTLATLKAIQPNWTKGDALRIDNLPSPPGEFNYNITRCRYAELYREMGLEEIGFLLSCNRDGAFIEGYAPDIEFTRTQTIMNGAPFCDFRYRNRS